MIYDESYIYRIFNGTAMFLRSITLVLPEIVLGKLAMIYFHNPVAGYFAIIDAAAIEMLRASPFINGFCGVRRGIQWRPSIKRNRRSGKVPELLRAWPEVLLSDIKSIYYIRIDDSHANRNRFTLNYFVEFFSFACWKLFGVVYFRIYIIRRKKLRAAAQPVRPAAPCPPHQCQQWAGSPLDTQFFQKCPSKNKGITPSRFCKSAIQARHSN